MKFSYQHLASWLKLKLSPAELADLIYLHITEVESLTAANQWAKCVVGQITAIRPHPNADKLQLATVDVGDQQLEVVCGAANIAVGMNVPVALIGAVLPGGMKIRPAIIRGERSTGMLCSRAELGLSGDASGIMKLKDTLVPGTPLGQALGDTGDTILELKVLANRPDYMSYQSLAREIAAVLKQSFSSPIETEFPEVAETTASALTVSVKSADCRRYLGRVVRNLQVGPSPAWLQAVLTASGLRPVNNIVDVANYVMLELGQPIHSFDYDKLSGGQIVVRAAKVGESLTGLDGIARTLDNQTLVIADKNQPVAIAGVMGSEGSGVTDTTRQIVIEAAAFDLVSIRNTARRLGLRTDASARFERGLDILLPELAMHRMLNLLTQLIPGCEILSGVIDLHDSLPPARRIVSVPVATVTNLLGVEISVAIISDILTRLDLPTTVRGDDLVIEVPNYRADITNAADIAEEVIRIYGVDQVASVLPTIQLAAVYLSPELRVEQAVRDSLVRAGLTEVYTAPFDTGHEGAVVLANPLTTTATHLKTTLVAGLADLEIRRDHFQIFEIGTVFAVSREPLPTETRQLAIRVHEPNGYRVVRGLLNHVLDVLGVKPTFQEVSGINGLRVMADRHILGEIVQQDNDGYVSLNLTAMTPLVNWSVQFVPPPKYPSVKMDMAFTLPSRVRIGALTDVMMAIDPLVARVELFDVFVLPDGTRSAAFHVELRSSTRTLTKADRDLVSDRIQKQLWEQYKAKLRDS
jgi:phenylalanyl-tRNA synthetase beta chain